MIPPRQDLTPDQRRQAIQALYDTLPKMECIGRCHVGCTGIDMSITERDVIRRRHGITIRQTRPTSSTTLHHDIHAYTKMTGQQVPIEAIPRDNPPCQALDIITKRCSVYPDRPLVCRIWGATEALVCPWNCKPERYLTNEEYYRLGWEINKIGGHETYTLKELAEHEATLATPEGKAAFDAYMRTKVVETERKWFHMYFGLHPELKPDHWWGEEETVGTQDKQGARQEPEEGKRPPEKDPVRERSSHSSSPGNRDA